MRKYTKRRKIGMDDVYEDLKAAAPEELFKVLLFVCEAGVAYTDDKRFSDGLKLGFKMATSDGWEHIAPAWLREYRGQKKNENS